MNLIREVFSASGRKDSKLHLATWCGLLKVMITVMPISWQFSLKHSPMSRCFWHMPRQFLWIEIRILCLMDFDINFSIYPAMTVGLIPMWQQPIKK